MHWEYMVGFPINRLWLSILPFAAQHPLARWVQNMLCFFDLRFILKLQIWNKDRRRAGEDRLEVASGLTIHIWLKMFFEQFENTTNCHNCWDLFCILAIRDMSLSGTQQRHIVLFEQFELSQLQSPYVETIFTMQVPWAAPQIWFPDWHSLCMLMDPSRVCFPWADASRATNDYQF